MADDIAGKLKSAAAWLFTQHGFTATRVADIVANAGVAQGTFYLHFENKPSLFVALIDEFFAGLIEETIARHPAKRLQTGEQLSAEVEEIWMTIIRYGRKHDILTRLVLREGHALPPEQRAHINRHFEQGADALAQYLEDAQQLGLVKNLPARLIAWLLVGMIERAMHYAVFVAPNAPSVSLAGHCTEFELRGLLNCGAAVSGCPS